MYKYMYIYVLIICDIYNILTFQKLVEFYKHAEY